MNLHEYQGKELIKKFGVRIQEGIPVETPEQAVEAARRLQDQTGTNIWVVKAQIHAGGRGKAGGVKVAKNLEDVYEKAKNILGATLVTPQTGPKGKKVNKVLIAQDVYYPGVSETKEFYMSVLLDREKSQNVIIYSTEGGMDIEEVADKTPHLLHKEWVDPSIGIMPFEARKIAFNLGLEGEAFKEMVKFVQNLYAAYVGNDCSLLEINPVLKSSDNKIIAVDTKCVIDANALSRHPEIAGMRDLSEEDPTEVKAGAAGLNFVKLDGNVGCMVNGAGLAMATMDIIKLSGGSPANFLDVGGTADAKRVETAFKIILQDPEVKAILVNIFGGIVRCDRVAQGIIDAYKNIGEIPVPIIVRLQGTNAVEAKKMIDESGLKVSSAILLKEAAALVQEAVA
ncbi:MAG: ADP-forming succinate--CoA ligase subunit beta [Bacteroidetes bacterium]|nr:ADP-forming succinate--CoA ligase subunit beta [Bacteroidota bacterium]MBP7400607.1 ADP-forming succinate--CoA ligase subunit beta [Chitinophagales bacterium]MBK7109831.1 ADP-forming succinate--CoA ligase subunit beta [Bacteroidota bacterium]MBK8487433.1 ADP-forming succinate--CoA ligase subunit beta [Bacteroidota bacterium]MBK8682824.1 ADP-forming succinate--CoA ligase subunit beta [Bacteroidota bacterium]